MRNRPLCSICLVICLIIGIGTVCGGEKLIKEFRLSAAEQYLQDKEAILLTGRVYQKTDKEKYQILYLRDNSIKYHQHSLKESRLIIYDEEKQEVDIGDVLTVSGELSFFESAGNPGNFDSKLYYQKQDIHAGVWAESIQKQKNNRRTFYENIKNDLHQFRKKWKLNICKAMGEKDGNILAAMLLGEKAEMDEELRELYQVNGIGHILAISGVQTLFLA